MIANNYYCSVLKSYPLPGLPNIRMEVFKYLFQQCTDARVRHQSVDNRRPHQRVTAHEFFHSEIILLSADLLLLVTSTLMILCTHTIAHNSLMLALMHTVVSIAYIFSGTKFSRSLCIHRSLAECVSGEQGGQDSCETHGP
jgi:hypothetical protein